MLNSFLYVWDRDKKVFFKDKDTEKLWGGGPIYSYGWRRFEIVESLKHAYVVAEHLNYHPFSSAYILGTPEEYKVKKNSHEPFPKHDVPVSLRTSWTTDETKVILGCYRAYALYAYGLYREYKKLYPPALEKVVRGMNQPNAYSLEEIQVVCEYLKTQSLFDEGMEEDLRYL